MPGESTIGERFLTSFGMTALAHFSDLGIQCDGLRVCCERGATE
jgi:hypothetical protein